MPKLIDNWKEAWRWMSVNCMTGAAALQAAWLAMPDDLRASLPNHFMSITTMGLLFMGLFGRLTTKKPRKKKS